MAVIEDLVHLLPHEGGEAEDGRQEKQCLFHLRYLVKNNAAKVHKIMVGGLLLMQ